jgi:hypothetical protein
MVFWTPCALRRMTTKTSKAGSVGDLKSHVHRLFPLSEAGEDAGCQVT